MDPHQLLRVLGNLLDSQGGAKGVPEILRIVSLMKDASKLVARCIYANILKNTTDAAAMDKFVQAGGWETLNNWLQEAKSVEDSAFILELVHVYRNIPVNVDLLKQNNCAKTIKQFSKSGAEELQAPCRELVNKWMSMIKSDTSASKSSSGDSSKKHSSSSSSKHSSSSDKDKSSSHRDRSSSSHKPSHKSKHHDSSKSSSKSSSGTEGSSSTTKKSSDSANSSETSISNSKSAATKDRTNSLDSNCSNASSISSVMTSSNKMAATSAFESILSSVDDKELENKANSSKDTTKAKTVKTAPTKFRSTGLEQEVVLPPSKKKKIENKLPVKRPSPLPKASKDQPVEKKVKSGVASPSGKEKIANSLSAGQEETHGKIKIIPAKPKPVEMFESSGFMDAIGASIVPSLPKVKRKKPLLVNTQRSSGGSTTGATSPPSATSPTALSPPHDDGSPSSTPRDNLPAFYKETLGSPTEKKSILTGEEVTNNNDDSKSMDGSTSVVESESSVAESVKEGKKKRKVTWAVETDLRSFFYFELDETERVNVNKMKNFEEIKKQEMQMEKAQMEDARKQASQWAPLIPILGLPEPLAQPGSRSTEREAQKQREESVLQALYFNRQAIPPTPAEADPEEIAYEEPRIMPLEDTSGEAVIDHTVGDNGGTSGGGLSPTSSLGSEATQFSLAPDVAALLQNMAQQVNSGKMLGGGGDVNGGQSPHSLLPSPEELANLPPDMQTMLQSFMGSKDLTSNEDLVSKVKSVLDHFNQGGQNHGGGPFRGGGAYQEGGRGHGLLSTPNHHMYGGGGGGHMPPQNSNPPQHPMDGYPPHPRMGYGPPQGGPPGGGYGRPSLLGPGPMRGGGGGPMGPGGGGPMGHGGRNNRFRGPHNQRRQVCRHFQAGKCDRDLACQFLHPGINGPPL